jgi:hypothetical protein
VSDRPTERETVVKRVEALKERNIMAQKLRAGPIFGSIVVKIGREVGGGGLTARLEGGTAHSEVEAGKDRLLILVGRGLVAYTTTHTRIESGWRIFAAPASFFTLIAREGLFTGTGLDLWTNALNLPVPTKDTCECDGTVCRSGIRAHRSGAFDALLNSLRVLCKDGLYPSWFGSGRTCRSLGACSLCGRLAK